MSDQFGLFGPLWPDGRIEIPLFDAAPLTLWRGWAKGITLAQFSDLPWDQHQIQTPFGRIAAPRLEGFYADGPMAVYRYSGEDYRARYLHHYAGLAALRDLVEHTTDRRWNAVFANRYAGGNDSIGWHADDEPVLGPVDQVRIASVSFGTTRTFAVKHKDTAERVVFELEHGDLLVMGPRVQANYLHSVPKRPGRDGVRLNFTFRHLVG